MSWEQFAIAVGGFSPLITVGAIIAAQEFSRSSIHSERQSSPNRHKCLECISGLVRLTEIPHMLYRSYDKPELAEWYLNRLESDSRVLLNKGCISRRTYEKFLEPLRRVREGVEEKDREKVYRATESMLSVLKSWAPIDITDKCTEVCADILKKLEETKQIYIVEHDMPISVSKTLFDLLDRRRREEARKRGIPEVQYEWEDLLWMFLGRYGGARYEKAKRRGLV